MMIQQWCSRYQKHSLTCCCIIYKTTELEKVQKKSDDQNFKATELQPKQQARLHSKNVTVPRVRWPPVVTWWRMWNHDNISNVSQLKLHQRDTRFVQQQTPQCEKPTVSQWWWSCVLHHCLHNKLLHQLTQSTNTPSSGWNMRCLS